MSKRFPAFRQTTIIITRFIRIWYCFLPKTLYFCAFFRQDKTIRQLASVSVSLPLGEGVDSPSVKGRCRQSRQRGTALLGTKWWMRETYTAKPNGIISLLSFIKFAISHGRSKVSAVASVGASASQRCPPDTRTPPLQPPDKLLRYPSVHCSLTTVH